MKVLNKELSNESSRELGPLKYVAKSLGVEMDKVVNYFLLLIVFVFDPLAICLVIAANFAFLRYTGDVEDSRSFSGWLGFLSKRYYVKKKQV
jgi:type IV secretory pathway VirB3-like protein